MTDLTEEQKAIIEASPSPLSVMACAGSGKTMTAVHRLMAIRRSLGNERGRVALLSFSNVAVETFRKLFSNLNTAGLDLLWPDRIEIDTVDGFITSNILKPHAHRTMGASRQAFLVTGDEPFLKRFFIEGKPPTFVAQLRVGYINKEFFFFTDFHGRQTRIDSRQAQSLITRLGKSGAYTHELGRYWCHRTLISERSLLRAYANRFPHILIDEAQDIGSEQQAILDLLSGAGSKISLIGDPNQGIYEYAGADGSYLRGHATRTGVAAFNLTRNFRSLPAITAVANAIAGRCDGVDRSPRDAPCGAYVVPYPKGGEAALICAFEQGVELAGLSGIRSAVLCRAAKLVETLRARDQPIGVGAVRLLAAAAIHRDKRADFHEAFRLVARAVECLLMNPPRGLAMQICEAARHPELGAVRRALWTFARSSDTGLPATSLQADTVWHHALKKRVMVLLQEVESILGLTATKNLGQRLSTRDLPTAPVSGAPGAPVKLRIDTVHRAKGESLDAVLYVASKAHVAALLAGTTTEEGRIGYVAVTRAKDLFWLGVPQACFANLRPALLARGFCERC